MRRRKSLAQTFEIKDWSSSKAGKWILSRYFLPHINSQMIKHISYNKVVHVNFVGGFAGRIRPVQEVRECRSRRAKIQRGCIPGCALQVRVVLNEDKWSKRDIVIESL